MKKDRKHILTRQQLIAAMILVAAIIAVRLFFALAPKQEAVCVQDEAALTDVASVSLSELVPFDPNTADSLTLLHNGLKPWQIRNMMKYRAKGGRYRKPDDFRKLYGLTDSAFLALRPYIRIDSTEWVAQRDSLNALRRERDSLKHLTDSLRRDSLYGHVYRHSKRDTMIELNAADTFDLQYIRGIGHYTAVQIVRYRNELGGYYSPEQIREIKGLQNMALDSVIPHLSAEKDSIKPLLVNTASVKRLQAHPYLSFEQAKALYDLRRSKITLSSMDDLEPLVTSEVKTPFTREDLQRLKPYLSFEYVKPR